MKKLLFPSFTLISCTLLLAFNSCSGCVKSATKKVTELGISAVEGAAEAVDEHGERVSEKATDAAGSVAVGVGKSLDRQMNEHANKVASVAGRTLVQTVDGFTNGFNAEVNTHYDIIPHTETFCSGVSLDYFAKSKNHAIIDAYFIILEAGTYRCKFECYNTGNKCFLTKEITINKAEQPNRKYSLVSFALNADEESGFKNIKDVKITVVKEKNR